MVLILISLIIDIDLILIDKIYIKFLIHLI